MTAEFISERLVPLAGTFDPAMMANGEPGVPAGFRWRRQELHVTAVLERSKSYGDCRHGSGERYVRQHRYLVRIADGRVLEISFQRTFARGSSKARWWLHRIASTP